MSEKGNIKMLSVIIPAYNAEKYIAKSIRSVLDNDLETNELEIIVVDDGSEDSTLTIATSFLGEGVQVIHQDNQGLGAARNKGLAHAKGQYVLFLDADDWYLGQGLQSICQIAGSHNLDILEFSSKGVHENGALAYHFAKSTHGKVLAGVKYCSTVNYMHSACNKLYNRLFLAKNDLFFLTGIYAEDYEFNTRAFLYASRVMAIDLLVVCFFQSSNSITRNSDRSRQEKMIRDLKAVLDSIHGLYKTYSCNSEQKEFFDTRLSYVVATLFYKLFLMEVSIQHIQAFKKSLVSEDKYYVSGKIHDFKKNVFRVVILQRPWTFAVFKRLNRYM